jgi:hypothetical protein
LHCVTRILEGDAKLYDVLYERIPPGRTLLLLVVHE